MTSEGLSTSERLMEVAEHLFATRGIRATLVSEIVSGAGQRNPSALRYHFGSLNGVLQAIIQRHQDRIEHRRATMLAQWPSPGPRSARDAVSLVVQPLVELLSDESGRHYLCILGQVIDQLDLTGTTAQTEDHPALTTSLDLLRQHVTHPDPAVVTERVRSVLLMITASTAARARLLLDGGPTRVSDATLGEQLVAMGAAALAA